MQKNINQLLDEFSDTHRMIGRMKPEQRDALQAIASVRRLANQQHIAMLGEMVDGVYLIVEGGVRLESFSESGDRFLVGDLQAGDLFGLLSVLEDEPSIHHATAIGETVACYMPAKQFRSFIYADQELTRQMVELMCRRLRMSLVMVTRFAPGSLECRVARCLIALADNLGNRPETGKSAKVSINQFDLAAMLSVSRQSVNRVLKSLEADGTIMSGYNTVEILDLDRLRQRM